MGETSDGEASRQMDQDLQEGETREARFFAVIFTFIDEKVFLNNLFHAF